MGTLVINLSDGKRYEFKKGEWDEIAYDFGFVVIKNKHEIVDLFMMGKVLNIEKT